MVSMNTHGGARPGAGRKSKIPNELKTHLEARYRELSEAKELVSLAKEHKIKPHALYNFGAYRGIRGSKPQRNFNSWI